MSPLYQPTFALAVLLAIGAAPARLSAQSPVVRGAAEWSITASAARGVAVLQSRGGQRYAMPSLAWGRILTDERGPRWIRGRFEWSIELSPIFVEWSSGQARGAAVAPLGWRWNLAPRGRFHPYLEAGGGAVWTSSAIPAGTTGTNFMAHAGIGVRIFHAARQAVVVGYRLHHISNGNRVASNPGVNAHMLTVGLTTLRNR
jgi:hypothetical protein